MLVLGRIDGSPSRYISRSASSSLVIQNLLRRRIHLKKCSSILSESCALPASSSHHAYIMIYTFVLRKATACFKEAVAVSTCTTRTRRLTRRAVPALPCATRKKKKKEHSRHVGFRPANLTLNHRSHQLDLRKPTVHANHALKSE